MWTAIAKILAVFDISPVKDAEGKLTEPNVKFTSMMTRWVMLFMCESRSIQLTLCLCSHPEPFMCDIHPRDERARKLILDSCQE